MDDQRVRAGRGAADELAVRERNAGPSLRRSRCSSRLIYGLRERIRPPTRAMPALVAAAMTALGCGGDGEIEKPTPLFTRSPVEYPLELWDQDIEGSTMVRVLVNEKGGVDSAMVMESSGHSELDSAAVHGALSMEFDPATKEGEPLRVWARVPVHFSKDGQPTGPGRSGNPGGEVGGESTANPNVTSGLKG